MKVVLFCGGLGTRLREFSDTIPKPMVNIGYRPIIWHIMKYYAHFGHKEFVLCLGYRGDAIKEYFLNYNECLSNDFILSGGGKELLLYNSDISDWTISFVDTGQHSNVGQRLKAVERHLEGEEMFMANYSDGLADIDLNAYIDNFNRSGKIACFLLVKPPQTFHIVSVGQESMVSDIVPVSGSGMHINGGFFIFRREIFKYMRDGEELVAEPFKRLIADKQLIAYPHNGFWGCMDTFRDKQMFDDLYSRGAMPWEVWKNDANGPARKP